MGPLAPSHMMIDEVCAMAEMRRRSRSGIVRTSVSCVDQLGARAQVRNVGRARLRASGRSLLARAQELATTHGVLKLKLLLYG